LNRHLADDGLFTPDIKSHSLDKILRHDFYATVFATSMKNRWPQRAYVGLYSGPGRARIEGTGEIIETSAMGALRAEFTHYIFVDRDPRVIEALDERAKRLGHETPVTLLEGDVKDLVGNIKAALPPFSRKNRLLSFCFVDPFAADLRFETIRQLSSYRMDFLILLMLGRDARTNFKRYYEDRSDTRIAQLIDSPEWRDEFRGRRQRVVPFLLRKFDESMQGLGYLECSDDLVHQVRVSGKRVFLYSLVFYSRHELGQQFWRETLRRTDVQTQIEFQ
jgi:three-Cys-motif partner protein